MMNLLWIFAAIIFVVEIIVPVLYYQTKPMPPLRDYIIGYVLAPTFVVCFCNATCELIISRLEYGRRNLQPYVISSTLIVICAILLVVHYFVTVVFVVYAMPIFFSLVYNNKRVLLFTFLSSIFMFIMIYAGYLSVANPPDYVANIGDLPANIAILCAAYLIAKTIQSRLEEVVYTLMETERSAYEAETAKKRAESVANARTRFVSNMSHGLRTPMHGIICLSEFALDDESIPERQKDCLQKIKSHANQFVAVIDDILDIAKISAGEAVLQKIPFDLYSILNECEAVTAPSAAEKGVRLYFYDETKLSHKLIGDPAKLRQTFLVFLSNAVKFTEHGSVTLVAKSDEESEADGAINIIFEISDTGIGMTEDALEQIFEPFYQVNSSDTRDFGGVGLGLCIAKNLIEAMGGYIDARSISNIGSRFSFSLTFALSHEKSVPEDCALHPAFEDAFNRQMPVYRSAVRRENNAAIDAIVGIENFAGSKPTYLQALDTFSKKYIETPVMLEKAARDKNFSLAQRTAHTEKGAAAIIGAHRLSELLAVLEESFRRDGLYFKDSMMDEYKDEHAKVLLYISELLV